MRGGPLTQSPIFVGFANYCSHFNHIVFIPKAYRCLGAVREACSPAHEKQQQQQEKKKNKGLAIYQVIWDWQTIYGLRGFLQRQQSSDNSLR